MRGWDGRRYQCWYYWYGIYK